MPTATKTPVSAKRSAAARKNGANSKGPVTAEGKAKSSQNALKHGLTAAKFLALPEDEEDAYEKFFDYMLEDLAPEGAEQEFYAARMIETMWRLRRIPSLEARSADPDPKTRRYQVGPHLYGGWLQNFGDLARYESSLERTLDKNRKALRQLQNEPKPPSGAPSSCDPRYEERRRKGLGMDVPTPNEQTEATVRPNALECGGAAPINKSETRPIESNTIEFNLDLEEGEYIRGLDFLPEPSEEDSQNEPNLSQPRTPEPRASEPSPTIELPIRSFEEQREYELIQVYLETHPNDTIFEAQKALYPKKYTRR